jgi:aryl hydrocarbon receptor nuclear translocator
MHSQLQSDAVVASAAHGTLLTTHIKQQALDVLPDLDREKEKQARENHCEIERRRRVKMAAYFNELCVMVPTCSTLQRKPDKLTILRMASSHMRNLRGNTPSGGSLNSDSAYKPSFLTDQELKHLILEAADGFLFVAQCDTGNIIYVSDAVQPVLSYQPNEWTHRSLFDFVHVDDVEKVKDQLSTQENSSTNTSGRVLDLKTGTVKKEGHPSSMRSHIGSRRSFICRVKLGQRQSSLVDPQLAHSAGVTPFGVWSTNGRANRTQRNTLQSISDTTEENLKTHTQPVYSVVHVTGYTKVWPPNSISASQGNQHHHHHHHQQQQQLGGYPQQQQQQEQHQNTNFHLIAIARLQMTSAPTDLVNSSNFEFVTRHDSSGVITFVDQRVFSILGYQSSELLKKSLHDFVIPQDQQLVKEQLKSIYETKQNSPIQMNLHFVMAGTGDIIPFQTSAYAFCNPCNEAFEFIVCTHVNQNRLNEIHLNDNSNLISNQTNSTLLNPLSTNNTTTQLQNSNIQNLDYSHQFQNSNQHNYYNNNNNNNNGGYQYQQPSQIVNAQTSYPYPYHDQYNNQLASSPLPPNITSNENLSSKQQQPTTSTSPPTQVNSSLTVLERTSISNSGGGNMAWSSSANSYQN